MEEKAFLGRIAIILVSNSFYLMGTAIDCRELRGICLILLGGGLHQAPPQQVC